MKKLDLLFGDDSLFKLYSASRSFCSEVTDLMEGTASEVARLVEYESTLFSMMPFSTSLVLGFLMVCARTKLSVVLRAMEFCTMHEEEWAIVDFLQYPNLVASQPLCGIVSLLQPDDFFFFFGRM